MCENVMFKRLLRQDAYRSMQTNLNAAKSAIKVALELADKGDLRGAAETTRVASDAFLRAAGAKDNYESLEGY